MSSLNVRFAQETRDKTREKTDLLNCTNLPDSDSAHRNHQARVGPHQENNSKTNASVCTHCICGDKIKRKPESLQKDFAELDRWGEAADYEKVTSI